MDTVRYLSRVKALDILKFIHEEEEEDWRETEHPRRGDGEFATKSGRSAETMDSSEEEDERSSKIPPPLPKNKKAGLLAAKAAAKEVQSQAMTKVGEWSAKVAEEIGDLPDQILDLSSKLTDLKRKIGPLEKAKSAMSSQLSSDEDLSQARMDAYVAGAYPGVKLSQAEKDAISDDISEELSDDSVDLESLGCLDDIDLPEEDEISEAVDRASDVGKKLAGTMKKVGKCGPKKKKTKAVESEGKEED